MGGVAYSVLVFCKCINSFGSGANAFVCGDEHVRTWRGTCFHTERNAFKMRARYTLHLISTVYTVRVTEKFPFCLCLAQNGNKNGNKTVTKR